MPKQIAVLTLVLALTVRCSAAELIQKEGTVEVTKVGAGPQPASIGMALVVHDKLRTAESSRAVIKMSAGWNARVDEETSIEITPTSLLPLDRNMMRLDVGRAFLYSRESKGEWKLQTRAGTATSKGTQLLVQVFPDGRTFLQVIEGEVDFANEAGAILLNAGEAGEAAPGQAPRKTAVLETRNLLQWALYYPAVLQPGELALTAGERQAVAASVDAYIQGDLLAALDLYPRTYTPVSPGSKLYRAVVLLATGRVDEVRRIIQDIPTDHAGRRALERMLAAVLMSEPTAPAVPATTTTATAGEALAESYFQQSRRQLEAARAAAKRSTELAPQSGFAWTRLAELEFSFGRTQAARAALELAIKLTPRNAQAHALRGYLLSAENRIADARQSFERAIQLDGALGNAWLGLGLTKIKQGQLSAGQSDLQTAVTVEPTRSFLYSYHAKALSSAEDGSLARKDLTLAKKFDPADPTPWLYSAILTQQENRYNMAIDELQESLRLNDNRRVYRSRFLLDQDRAVRSSSLANIYHNNGMTDLAVREATRAVEGDYTNASAHLFLANSFAALRDPKAISLRYENAWFNEQLLANLLAPVGGGPLSQFISQQEYSKLLEADGFGGSSVTEARDDGYFSEQASLFGTKGKLSVGLDFSYHRDNEIRPNNDNAIKEIHSQLKYQTTADDVLYALVRWRNQKNGDLLQTYDNVPGNPGLRFEEKQEPGMLLLGWNHRWAPGMHTLVLGGRLASDQGLIAPNFFPSLLVRDPGFLQPDFLRPGPNGTLEYTSPVLRNATVPPVSTNPDGSLNLSPDFRRAIAPFLGHGAVTGFDIISDHRLNLSTRRQFEIYTAEIEHLWQRPRNTLLLGGRWQGGTFDTHERLDLAGPALLRFTTSPAGLEDVSVPFKRLSLYVYDLWTLVPKLTLIVGGAWDDIKRPDNFRNPPVNDREVRTRKASGKLGLRWSPSKALTVRGIYTESVGGVSSDESVRLEPVQLAGFNQAFRSIISESLIGSVDAPVYHNAGLSVEGALPTRTWWVASVNSLSEHVERTLGTLDRITAPIFPSGRAILPSSTSNILSYRERIFTLGINQLIGNEFAVGATYHSTRAALRNTLPEVPSGPTPYADEYSRATLEDLALGLNWNSSSGVFARADAHWYSQDLHGTAGDQLKLSPPGDHFWHFNAQLGCRFQRNRHEVSAGVLNLTGRDYQLSPLTELIELPRERTYFVRCKFNF